jgi:hypothetical protein
LRNDIIAIRSWLIRLVESFFEIFGIIQYVKIFFLHDLKVLTGYGAAIMMGNAYTDNSLHEENTGLLPGKR